VASWDVPVPSADLPALRGAERRTTALRLGLAAALAAALAATVIVARNLQTGGTSLLPAGSNGVVVLDLSRSVDPNALRRMGAVLRNLIKSDASVGLVVFSDVAYELLPPRTPARALKPVLRFFTESGGTFPDNPWSPVFRAGTRISQGLEIARDMLVRAHVRNGSILLVSDLGTSSGDIKALTRDLIEFRDGPIPVKLVPLNPLARDRQLFARFLGSGAFVASTDEPLGGTRSGTGLRSASALPVALLVAAGVLLLVLALNELACGRLELPRRRT
jgi:hypothetical protein